MKKSLPLNLWPVLVILAFSVVAVPAWSETFYERKPADIFLGEKTDVTTTAVTVLPSGTIRAELSNGMVVLLKENHATPIAIAQVAVKTGSIYEQEYLGAGISHLFEHLMHSVNTTTRTEQETKKILESIGNITNASTSYDETAYYIKVSKNDLGTAIDLLADWMKNAKITEAEFTREMQVVQRESERSNTSPGTVLYRMLSETLFLVHPARYPVIGYDHVRAKLRMEDAENYRARMYVPNNMVFVAVGDFAWSDTLEKIRTAFNGFLKGSVPAIALPSEPEQVAKREVKRGLANLNTTLIDMSYRTVRLTHPDLYALDVLAGVLGQGESSRLVRVIKNDRQLVESISAWSFTPGYDAGQFTISASIPEQKNVQDVRDGVIDQIELLKRKLVDKSELQRVKNGVAADHVYRNEMIEAQAGSLVSGYISAGDPDFDERYVTGIQQVTPQEIRRVANQYFPDDKLCVAIVEPQAKPEAGKGGLAGSAKESPVQKTPLASGLRVLTKRNPIVPDVAFELYFAAGLRVETEATNGISNFAAQLWGKSTKKRSATALAAELEGMGANLSTGSANNTFFLRGTCLAKDFDHMLDIVADLTLRPAFDPKECEKLRTIILSSIKERDDSVYSQTQRLLQRTFYPAGNPYSMDMMGRTETVSAFTAGQLAEFYRTYARGPNGVLAVFGDVDPAAAQAKIAKAFEARSPDFVMAAPAIKPVPEPVLNESRTEIAYRERKDAAAVFFAFPAPKLTDMQDRYPMEVLDVVLGGGQYPGGWLHAALRGAGLVYEVHTFNLFGLDPRHFQIQAITNPAAVDQVKSIILEKVEKMKKGEIADDEFRSARKIAVTEQLMDKQTNSAQAQTAAIDELYGLGYDFSKQFPEKIEAVTIPEVVRVANKYLTRYACAIVTQKDAKKEEGEKKPEGEPKKP